MFSIYQFITCISFFIIRLKSTTILIVMLINLDAINCNFISIYITIN